VPFLVRPPDGGRMAPVDGAFNTLGTRDLYVKANYQDFARYQDTDLAMAGDGEAVGAPLVADPRIAGVAFTGSDETARRINAALAARPGRIDLAIEVPLPDADCGGHAT